MTAEEGVACSCIQMTEQGICCSTDASNLVQEMNKKGEVGMWGVIRLSNMHGYMTFEQETSGAFVPTCTTQIFQKISKSWSRKNIFFCDI